MYILRLFSQEALAAHYCAGDFRFYCSCGNRQNLLTKTTAAHAHAQKHITGLIPNTANWWSRYECLWETRQLKVSPIAEVTPHVSQTALRSTFRSKPTKSLCFLSKGPSKSCNLMTSCAKHSLSHPWIHKTGFFHENASSELTETTMLNDLCDLF